MRPSSTAFTEGFFKKITKDESARGKAYTDSLCRGLMAWVAKDGVVTFFYRQRVPGIQKRVQDKLGIWSNLYSVNHARDAANNRRSEIALHGLRPKLEVPTLGEAIPRYEEARR